jgi:hypothetical protein
MSRSKSSQAIKKDSIKDLKLKLELDELRKNLTKDLSLPKKKVVESPITQESLCNYINCDKLEEKTVRKVIRKMLDFKKTNRTLSQEILGYKRNTSWKEKMILQLLEEVDYYMLENDQLKSELYNISTIRCETEHNKNGVTEYCKNLKRKFKDFVKTIDAYEGQIYNLKSETMAIVRANEAVIDMKSKII